MTMAAVAESARDDDEAELADWAEVTTWSPSILVVETEDEEDALRSLWLEKDCILAKLVAVAKLMPGLMLCTKLGLVRLPFGDSTSMSSVEGMVTKGIALLPPPADPGISKSGWSSSNSAMLGLALVRNEKGVVFLPVEDPEDKDLP